MKKPTNKKLSDKTQVSSIINSKEISWTPKLIWISYISKKRKPILLSFLTLLVLFDVYAINPFSLLMPNYVQDSTSSSGGMDVYYLCDNQSEKNYSANVYLNILHNERDINVIVDLKNNNQSGSLPQKIVICFPGITVNHMSLRSMDSNNESDIKYISEDSPIKRNIDRNISVTWNPLFGTEYIIIDTRRVPNFNGGIEFFWPNGVKKLSLFKFELNLPFGAPNPPDYYQKGFQRIESYELQVVAPIGYKIDTSNPQWTKYFMKLGHGFYTFNISLDYFRADFSHYNAESYENFLTLVSSLLLGVFISQILSNEK